MGFNLAFKELQYPLTLILLTWSIWWAPINASRWQMGFNSAFKDLIPHFFLGTESAALWLRHSFLLICLKSRYFATLIAILFSQISE